MEQPPENIEEYFDVIFDTQASDDMVRDIIQWMDDPSIPDPVIPRLVPTGILHDNIRIHALWTLHKNAILEWKLLREILSPEFIEIWSNEITNPSTPNLLNTVYLVPASGWYRMHGNYAALLERKCSTLLEHPPDELLGELTMEGTKEEKREYITRHRDAISHNVTSLSPSIFKEDIIPHITVTANGMLSPKGFIYLWGRIHDLDYSLIDINIYSDNTLRLITRLAWLFPGPRDKPAPLHIRPYTANDIQSQKAYLSKFRHGMYNTSGNPSPSLLSGRMTEAKYPPILDGLPYTPQTGTMTSMLTLLGLSRDIANALLQGVDDLVFFLTRGYSLTGMSITQVMTIAREYNALPEIQKIILIDIESGEYSYPISNYAATRSTDPAGFILNITIENITSIAKQIGMVIPPEANTIVYVTMNMAYYIPILDRGSNITPSPNNFRLMTDEEILAFIGVYVPYTSRQTLVSEAIKISRKSDSRLPFVILSGPSAGQIGIFSPLRTILEEYTIAQLYDMIQNTRLSDDVLYLFLVLLRRFSFPPNLIRLFEEKIISIRLNDTAGEIEHVSSEYPEFRYLLKDMVDLGTALSTGTSVVSTPETSGRSREPVIKYNGLYLSHEIMVKLLDLITLLDSDIENGLAYVVFSCRLNDAPIPECIGDIRDLLSIGRQDVASILISTGRYYLRTIFNEA